MSLLLYRSYPTTASLGRLTRLGLGQGVCFNSSREGLSIDGQLSEKAKSTVVTWLKEQGIGERKINYKLRDWLFARQRYWGEPFLCYTPKVQKSVACCSPLYQIGLTADSGVHTGD